MEGICGAVAKYAPLPVSIQREYPFIILFFTVSQGFQRQSLLRMHSTATTDGFSLTKHYDDDHDEPTTDIGVSPFTGLIQMNKTANIPPEGNENSDSIPLLSSSSMPNGPSTTSSQKQKQSHRPSTNSRGATLEKRAAFYEFGSNRFKTRRHQIMTSRWFKPTLILSSLSLILLICAYNYSA